MMYHENGVRTFYKGMPHAFVRMNRTQPTNSVHTGFSAALTSVAPQAGIQFASYHLLSSAWDKLGATEVSNKQTGRWSLVHIINMQHIVVYTDQYNGYDYPLRVYGRVI